MTEIRRGAIPLTAANASGQVATALLLAAAAREGDPGAFAILAGGMGAVTLLSNVIDFGNNAWTVRQRASGRLGDTEFSALVRSKLLVAAVVAVGSVLVVLAASESPDLRVLALGLAAMLPLRVLVMSWNAFMLGEGRFVRAGATVAVERWLALLAALLVLYSGLPLTQWAPSCVAVGGLLSAAVAATAWMPKSASRMAGPIKSPLHLWRRSSAFGLQSVATDALLLDSWIVSAVASPAVAGTLALGSRLTAPAGFIGTALGSVTLSLHSRPTEDRRPDVWTPVLVALALGVAALSSFWWLPVVFNNGYHNAPSVFAVYCASAALTVANQPMASRLQAMHRERTVTRIVAPGALLAIALLALGARLGGALGGSVGVVAANAMIFIALWRAEAGASARERKALT